MTEETKSLCLFCSLGCGLTVRKSSGNVPHVEYDREDPRTRGKLCAKGNLIASLLDHPKRIETPTVDGRPVSRQEASHAIAKRMTRASGLIVEGDASSEDLTAAVDFGRTCLSGGPVAVSFPTGDDAVLSSVRRFSEVFSMAEWEDLRASTCTVAVGDPFALGPVVAGPLLEARNAQRGNSLSVISATPGLTSRFAKTSLIGSVRGSLKSLLVSALGRSAEKPEWGKVILGQPEPYPPQRPAEIQTLANDLAGAGRVVIVTATSDPVAASLAALLAGALGSKAKVFILTDYGNASDIVQSQPGLGSVEEILHAIDRGSVKTLLTLGVDLVSSYPGLPVEERLAKLDHLIAGSSFPTETTRRAEIVLPTTLWIEEDAVRAGKSRRSAVLPPGAAQSYGKILASIAAARGRELHAKSMEAAHPRKATIRELCLELIEEARKEPAAPRVKSTETRFAGGWLTGYSDWVRARFARCPAPPRCRAPIH